MSVRTSEPLIDPATVGAKLMGRVHEVPAAKVPVDEDVLPVSGQVPALVLLRVTFAEMLGLLPVWGRGKLRFALPMFSSVIVCEALVEPTLVDAKLRLGASA